MARSAVVTNSLRVSFGLHICSLQNLFVVTGKTSDWSPEPGPDAANPNDTAPTEPIVAIRPYLVTMAREVSAEDYELLASNKRISLAISEIIKYFEYIDTNDAYDDAAGYVLALAEYNISLGHPAPSTDGFRAYYLCSGLEPSAGHEQDDYLEPINIESYGSLLYINNGEAIPISGGEFSADLVCLINLNLL